MPRPPTSLATMSRSCSTFADQIRLPTGERPTGIAVADLDGDAIPDLLSTELGPGITPPGGPTYSVFRGLGNGQFAEPQVIPFMLWYMPTLADLDRDGRHDFLAWPFVRMGNGDGTFRDSVYYDSHTSAVMHFNQFASKPTVVDLDGDGDLDVVGATLHHNTVTVQFGRADGTFLTTPTYPVGWRTYAVDLADFDLDGVLDVATATHIEKPFEIVPVAAVLQGTGNATFGPPTEYRTRGAGAIATGDLNHDGRIDLALTGANDLSILLDSPTGPSPPRLRLPPERGPAPSSWSMPTRTGISISRSATSPITR